MKLLRNPAVTGVLVLIAVGVVAYQVIQGTRGRGGGQREAMAAAATSEPASAPSLSRASAGPKTSSAANSLSKQPGIDRRLIGMQFHSWVQGASRDPFQLNHGATPKKVIPINAPSPTAKWKLKAILLQTGSRMAIINNQIYREGDSIDGYRIVSIDEDTVWFQTPDSREHLGFQKRSPVPVVLPPSTSPGTNDAAAATPEQADPNAGKPQ